MSNRVWDAENGWHDGVEVTVKLDESGRIVTEPGGEVVECQWVLMCENDATGTQSHPILGDVPICDRCQRSYDKNWK